MCRCMTVCLGRQRQLNAIIALLRHNISFNRRPYVVHMAAVTVCSGIEYSRAACQLSRVVETGNIFVVLCLRLPQYVGTLGTHQIR